MANMFGLLLAAVVVIFIIARLMKDAKAFSKLMAIFAISLIVGAGVKEVVAQTTATSPEKTVVVTTESAPMHNNSTPFVAEPAVVSYPDCASKENTDCDSVAIETEGLPTMRPESEYLDDS